MTIETLSSEVSPVMQESASAGEQEACLQRIDLLGSQLLQTSTQIETSVLDLCDSFNNIASRARSQTSRLLGLLNQGDKPQAASFELLLTACNHTLVGLLDAQNRTNEILTDAIGRLHRIDEAAVSITRELTQLDQISHSNRLLALNARIEASHSPQHERGFTAVAIELRSQTNRSMQVTENVAGLSTLLRQLAGSALVDLEQMQQSNMERSSRVRADADRTMEGLSGAYRTMREAVDQSQMESSLLADEISQAIRGMQFQDRVSQQIHHVAHDLGVLRQRLANNGTGADTEALGTFSALVMHEERRIYGMEGDESPEGDIELF